MLTIPPVLIGTYPTPVQYLEALSRPGASLWVKRDDMTNPIYGGNKVRKIEKILTEAQARGAKRILTVGAIGSNYVLAMGVFARSLGIGVDAVVVPQPATPHVRENFRVDLAQGVRLFPAKSQAHAALLLASMFGRGAYYVPAGGSNLVGVGGYVDAAREFAAQVRGGAMPEPDLVVVALGSGGTAAGLSAGFTAEKMRTRVLGITVAEPPWLVERLSRSLAKRSAPKGTDTDPSTRLEHDRRYLGAGYGHATPEGERAIQEATKVGLSLDRTYTAKAFAAALDRVAAARERHILYWHTLSSADMAPLLRDAPQEQEVNPRILALLRETH